MCGVYASIYVYRRGLCTESAITMKKNNGFTLIEILVAATIISVLSIIGVTSYISINKRSRDAKRKSDLEQVRSALEMYRTDTGSYPGSSTGFSSLSPTLDVLVSTYMPSVPKDPKSTSATTIPYYYSPLGSAPFYSYCICANLESEAGSNTCSVTPIANCTYYLKNP